MEAEYSRARALPPPQDFYQYCVVSHSCQERGIPAASRAVGQGGFCGTAVTPSGDTARSRAARSCSTAGPWRPPHRASDPTRYKEGASAFCKSTSGSTRTRFQRNSAYLRKFCSAQAPCQPFEESCFPGVPLLIHTPAVSVNQPPCSRRVATTQKPFCTPWGQFTG